MTKFFITHSWKDIEFARKLCDDLSAHNLDGFFDAYSIKPGDMVAAEIQRGLEACDVYVPILSYASLASPWCEEEINAAITLGKMPGRNGRPRIIPLLIENCQDKMPVFLHSRLYIVFLNRYDDALKELLTKGLGVPFAPQQPPVAAPPAPKIVAPPPPKIATLPRTIIHPKTGTEMILIPAGEFVMGEGSDAHSVYLDAFYIARYPVTNAEYKKFVDTTEYSPPSHWSSRKIPQGKENHPVVNVSWHDVVAYCKWAGGRLPTEAEWEKVASWDDAKKEKRVYPWGNEFDEDKCNSFESGIVDTTPVGKYSPQGDSAYGVGDMVGNVWEWCSSLNQKYPYRADDGREDMKSDGYRVLRGGSWYSLRDHARAAARYGVIPDFFDNLVGVRVVFSPKDSGF